MATQAEIRVQDIDHVGIIAGIIDEMGLVPRGRSFPPVLLPIALLSLSENYARS
jgi:hypothetical protein